ncbi:helix-turn-helix domain-containing protein [Xanthocytophaga agilis]|uniref:Helix-turn-helix domain-containing protein n=1 Tax=Xanthocytophaga agilis TaxID=3048010 RepID=A0AAE3R8V2_9BACT|nr:helix-turn-helix domain-containing protein [Xanthocytophaga agilis]MDJ1503539.1 helix-turn-helix domain-containing protein [Xanthocytophaga agilis]
MKTTGEIFDAIVEALGISYAELAKKVGLSRPDLFYNMRAGKSNPGYETLQAIAKAYPQINCRFMLTGEGDPLIIMTNYPKDEFKEYIKKILKELINEGDIKVVNSD